VSAGRHRTIPKPNLTAIWRVCRSHRQAHGRYPNLIRPRRYAEKIQWRKLFDLNPLYPVVTDKLAARDFIVQRAGAEYLLPLLWSGDAPEDIPFDTLVPPYVLKCTHGSGYNVIVPDDASLDRTATRDKLRGWLAINFGEVHHEAGYVPIEPRLLAEPMLREGDGTPPVEHKIFTFDGKARVIQTIQVERDRSRFTSFHDPDWHRIPWRGTNPPPLREPDRPPQLDNILAVAERVAAGFDHIRVDMYEWRGTARIGELTLYNASGLSEFTPDEAGALLGRWWTLRSPVRRALKAMLSRVATVPSPDLRE